jgi:hypothetical protein
LKTEKPKQTFERKRVAVGVSDGIKIQIKGGITAKDKVRGAVIEEKKPDAQNKNN